MPQSSFARRRALPCCIRPAALDDGGHSLVVLPPVVYVHSSRLRVGRRVGIRVAQQRLDGCEHRRHIVNRAPVVLQDVEADAAVRVDCGEGVRVRKEQKAPELCALFGWNIFDSKRTVGDLFGYSSVNVSVSLKVPGGRSERWAHVAHSQTRDERTSFPRRIFWSEYDGLRTSRGGGVSFVRRGGDRGAPGAPARARRACQTMMLLSEGVPLMPGGGSFCSLR